MANMMGPPLLRPFNPIERRPNADGSYSTEITTTWQLPDGQWANVPSLWMGPQGPVQFNPDDEDSIMTSMRNLEQINGPSFQRYPNVQAAEAAAQERSSAGGAGSGQGVTLNINGQRVKVGQEFLSLSPEEQNATVDEIAQSLGGQQSPEQPVYDGGWFKAATEGSQAGLMGGFDDEIGAGMLAPIDAAIDWFKGDGFDMGRAYNRKQQMLDQQKQARRTEHPVASIGGELAGGLALGSGAAKAGLSLAAKPTASVLAKVGSGAVEGAGYGALYGAGEAKPGERLSGAGHGAAFGGLTGGAIGALGGALAKRAASKMKPATPTSDDLTSAAQKLYQSSEAEGVRYTAPAVQRLKNNLKFAAGRVNDKLRPKTAGFVDDLEALSGDMPLEVFDELRKSINLELRRASPDDARTLTSMKRIADAFADNVGTGDFTGDAAKATDLLKQARQTWARSAKTETIEKILDAADVDGAGKYTQSGFANAVRREMRSLYRSISKGQEKGWSPEEIALIRQMARGGSNSQVINLFAKLAPRGVVSFMGGQLAGSMVPVAGNVAVPLAGELAARAADRGAMQAAQTLRTGAALGRLPTLPALPNKLAPLIPGMTESSMATGRTLIGQR